MKPVKKLTVSAILTALCVLLLYLGCVVPNLGISLVAAAALLPAVSVIHCGCIWAAGVYAASGFLALLLLPDKSCAVWFLTVLGHYGILKSLIEQLKRPVFEWILKLAVFGVCICVIYFLFRTAFVRMLPQYGAMLLFAVLAVCFVLYDIAFSALISFYCRRIKPHIQ